MLLTGTVYKLCNVGTAVWWYRTILWPARTTDHKSIPLTRIKWRLGFFARVRKNARKHVNIDDFWQIAGKTMTEYYFDQKSNMKRCFAIISNKTSNLRFFGGRYAIKAFYQRMNGHDSLRWASPIKRHQNGLDVLTKLLKVTIIDSCRTHSKAPTYTISVLKSDSRMGWLEKKQNQYALGCLLITGVLLLVILLPLSFSYVEYYEYGIVMRWVACIARIDCEGMMVVGNKNCLFCNSSHWNWSFHILQQIYRKRQHRQGVQQRSLQPRSW